MEKFSAMLEKKLLPLANKISGQKYIKAISYAFMSIIPFLTIGSLALVLISPPMDYTTLQPGFVCSFMKGWADIAAAVRIPVRAIYKVTMEYMSIFVAAGIANYLGKHYQMKGFTVTVAGIVGYLILAGVDIDSSTAVAYMGGTGLFAAIFASIVAVEILRFLTARKIGYISLEGNGVPEALTESFAMLIPTGLVLLAMGVIHWAVVLLTGNTFPELMTIIMTPLLNATNSVWGGIILVFLVMTFWWFGIHDTCITGPMKVFWTTALTANIAAYTAGTAITQLPYIILDPFWWFFVMIGGSGATFGLVLVLLTACKSKQLKTVGKLGIVPAFFNINEPVIFGVPLMMNPVMYIPFVGAPLINCIITYICMATGLVGRAISYPGWNLFCPVAALLSTVDIKAMILVFILIVVDALVYLPFVKVLDKQKLAEEQQQEN